MNLTLTWDLFIIVFFAIVTTYTFIIGKKESVKIIIASYIAIVAVAGLGNVLQRVGGATGSALSFVGLGLGGVDAQLLPWIKLGLFVAIVIFLAVRAGFDIHYAKEGNAIINTIITAVMGVATAGLLLSTVLTYVSGVPMLDPNLTAIAAKSPVIQQSQLMQLMILNQDLWFSLPALALIVAGFVHRE